MTRRRYHRATTATALPQYEWAFDAQGAPVHIDHAAQGTTYYCPLCGGKMIARKGEVKRHHFAHDQIQVCTPEEVAHAAASRWLAQQLRACLPGRQAIRLTWPCPLCFQNHSTDLLDGITQVWQEDDEVQLVDASGAIRTVILLNKPEQMPQAYMTLILAARDLTHRMSDLATLLSGAVIYGGLCTVRQAADETGIITDDATLRNALIQAVFEPPHYVYGPLRNENGLTHVFSLDSRKLWLPPNLWQRVVGGMQHAINPALHVISQEWPQADGSTVALYYVTAHNASAIAVRRFEPDQPVYARLNTALFQTSRLTATSVARSFAEL